MKGKANIRTNTIRRDIALGLYCASIIMGAGLLSLPNVAARLGVLPLLVTIVIVGAYTLFIYRHLASSLYAYLQRAATRQARLLSDGLSLARGGNGRPKLALTKEMLIVEEVRERGSRQLAELIRDTGLGNAGRTSLVLGMFFYVFFADIGYITIGSRSLNAISQILSQQGNILPLWLGLVSVGLVVLAWHFEKIFSRPFLMRGTLKKICVMAGTWLGGVATLLVLPDTGPFALGLGIRLMASEAGLVLFTAAILAGMLTRTGVSETRGDERAEPTEQHTVNIIVVLITIALLFLTAAVIMWVASRQGLFVNIVAVTPKAFSLATPEIREAWARMIGLVIFAFVGTGIFNLCSYPSLFAGSGTGIVRATRLDRVVIVGTLVPMIIYVLWTLVSVSVLPLGTLATLDQAKQYSIIGIAKLFSNTFPMGVGLMAFFGYSVALLAVTSACNGFTESLADQIGAVLEDTGHFERLTRSSENMPLRVIVLLVALVAAIALDNFVAIDLSTLLAVSGNAGGGLLILILPFFLPAPGKTKSPWSSIMLAFMTAVILSLLGFTGIDFRTVDDAGFAVVTATTSVIAISITGMALWLIFSEPDPIALDADHLLRENLEQPMPMHYLIEVVPDSSNAERGDEFEEDRAKLG